MTGDDIVRVSAMVHGVEGDVETDAQLLVELRNGAIGTVHASWSSRPGPDHQLTIVGTEGTLHLDSRTPLTWFTLTGEQMLIGRRSRSRGTDPAIDCSGPPEDPAISHRHAMLVRDEAGNYAVCDLGSVNGTTINDDPKPIPMNMPVPLRHGDDVHIGAFTTITLRDMTSRSD